MAKYKKRSDGRYVTSIMLNLDGEKKKKYVYGKTIKEVDDKIAELRSQANKGIVVDDRSITLAQWAQMWYSLYKSNKSANTQEMYSLMVKHIVNKLGDYRLADLKKYMLQELLNEKIAEGHIRTAETIRLTLKQLISAAIDEQYIYVDITKGLSVPKEQKAEKEPLSDDEIKSIMDADLSVKERAFLYLLLYTGIRKGEALALSCSDLDFNGNKIKIDKNLIYVDHRAEIKNSPKSAAGRRNIPLPGVLVDVLKEYISKLEEYEILFPQIKKNDYMTTSSFMKFWKGIKNKVGISRNITPHLLRHTYATRLYYAGIDIKQAQYLLGHSSISVTLGIYTHLDKQQNENSIQKLENLY